jgi:NitT/TauT family transport system substrate-binding protein
MTGSGAFISRTGDADKYRPVTTEALTGKKIAVIRGSAADIAFRGALLEKGIDLSKVKFVELDAHATSVMALSKGEVDLAVIGAPFREAAKNQGMEIVYHVDEIAPNYVCCRITTLKENLVENRQHYIDYFKAQIRAYKIFKTDEKKALDYAEKYFTIDRDILQKELYEIGHISLNPDPSVNSLKELYNRLKLIGVANSNLDLDEYIDLSVYEEALDSIISENPNDPFYQEMKQYYLENNKQGV